MTSSRFSFFIVHTFLSFPVIGIMMRDWTDGDQWSLGVLTLLMIMSLHKPCSDELVVELINHEPVSRGFGQIGVVPVGHRTWSSWICIQMPIDIGYSPKIRPIHCQNQLHRDVWLVIQPVHQSQHSNWCPQVMCHLSQHSVSAFFNHFILSNFTRITNIIYKLRWPCGNLVFWFCDIVNCDWLIAHGNRIE